MPIYVDVSSAVHAKAGIGRYAESLARALIDRQPARFALFYNRVRGSSLPEGLESVSAAMADGRLDGPVGGCGFQSSSP
jgi:hypothetical protein